MSAYICSSAPIATLLATFWIPESPIWLVQNEKYEEADKAILAMNRKESEFIEEVIKVKREDRKVEKQT